VPFCHRHYNGDWIVLSVIDNAATINNAFIKSIGGQKQSHDQSGPRNDMWQNPSLRGRPNRRSNSHLAVARGNLLTTSVTPTLQVMTRDSPRLLRAAFVSSKKPEHSGPRNDVPLPSPFVPFAQFVSIHVRISLRLHRCRFHFSLFASFVPIRPIRPIHVALASFPESN
jgi:hypothetical protein